MENIKKIYIKEDGTPLYTHYNGSWNVMKMETTDGLDYSYPISEMMDEGVYGYEEETGLDCNGDDYIGIIAEQLQLIAEYYEIELVMADWFLEKESQLNYLQSEMMNTNCVCDYIFNGGEKPHFTKIWEQVSEGTTYTMEDIHKIIYGYSNTTEFAFIVGLDDKFYNKVEKMKIVVESEDTEELWDMLENNFVD
jgi:hypothetical protein